MQGQIRRLVTAGLAVMCLTDCAPRATLLFYPEAAQTGAVQDVLVASDRVPLENGFGYSRDVARGLSFSEVSVSVPPDRLPGTVTFPTAGRAPDPRTDFLTVSARRFPDRNAFLRAINSAVSRQPAGQRDAFVFVHGFNTNFAEGLYRQAQMRQDLGTPGVGVHYAWPSAGSISAYATDRETVLIARDGLQELLGLVAQSNAPRIVVLGHSMGALVVMESLRQIALSKDYRVLNKIEAVVLMAPDLDPEVFRRQMMTLARTGLKVYVLTSSRDRALRFSAWLRGTSDRVGTMTSSNQFADLPVEVIDLSNVQGEEDSLNHFKAVTSPAVISVINGMGTIGLQILQDLEQPLGLLETSVGLVQGAGQTVLDKPGFR